jgi:uncharacterized protein
MSSPAHLPHKDGRRRWALPRLPGKLRAYIRATHRDFGYVAVGLTFIYAASGIAVNHIADWDPNFTQVRREFQVSIPAGADDTATANTVLADLGIREPPLSVYRVSPERLEVTLSETSLFIAPSGQVVQEGQSPRWLLRAANWLHLNRGKRAWTYVADAYAVVLLGLAVSGLFMIPGRNGFWGRGVVLVALGAMIPTAYVVLNGP